MPIPSGKPLAITCGQFTRHPGSRALPLALQVLALRCMVEVLLSPTEEPSTPVGQVS